MIETSFYVVPTPIGNLGDITLRSIEVLKQVDEVLAEDTRKALNLLNHYGIKKKITSLHKDNEKKNISLVLSKLKSGLRLALISEAGTPCISDPGHFIIKELIKNNLKFEVLPGATAFVPALIMSGFPSDHFFFYGFLKHKKSEKIKEIERLTTIKSTLIFYEAPHRVKDTLKILFDYFTPPFAVIREISKIYEETVFIDNINEVEDITVKGEFVIVVDNNKETYNKTNYADYKKIIKGLYKEGFDKKDIVKILKTFGLKRNDAYNLVEFVFNG
ncbi:16S rRNA (cytidine(1402)-2'-O)-methyltransferase [Deferribacter autotrophicus]|uniref:Ribosomal RNA small subunit methyltransferase I n=1 Tax=Deferribacter autotrophicus TaxID=500465 RepID=A0A5A8F0B5_9BACT|nr:16S rRNA (cytidine(1402)-2'-O)-methyltransferase [Deferribacter autotrophicus]KAA0256812.1 16S rRNA (cytidine(1402)-2'-O)-methyltransferase [Deferribacter autotrophicus]